MGVHASIDQLNEHPLLTSNLQHYHLEGASLHRFQLQLYCVLQLQRWKMRFLFFPSLHTEVL